MKAFTLSFTSTACIISSGITLQECIDKDRHHVAGLPVNTGENSIIMFNKPTLKPGDVLTDIDFDRKWSQVPKLREAYTDVAFIHIPTGSVLDYHSEDIQKARYLGLFYGGLPTDKYRNSGVVRGQAAMLLGASECIYLDCIFERDNLRTKQFISFDGTELSAGIVRKAVLRHPIPTTVSKIAKTPKPFGTSLADLLTKK